VYSSQTKHLAVALMLCAMSVVTLILSASPAGAQSPEPEPAIVRTADDDQLQWGPCPAFLPEGCQIAVLHGDPAKPNADVFFRVPGKSKLALHWHTSAEHMVLLAGELHVSYESQSPAIMKPGTYAYGPARRPHSGVCASDTPCVLFIAFESPVDAIPVDGK
jgi:quercetin dioxygenase-like cupin family protein